MRRRQRQSCEHGFGPFLDEETGYFNERPADIEYNGFCGSIFGLANHFSCEDGYTS